MSNRSLQDSVSKSESISIVPVMVSMMSSVMATVIVPTIVEGAIVNSSMVVLISVLGTAVAAVVIAGLVILRCTTESDAEALCLQLVRGHSQQSQDRQYEENFFHWCTLLVIRRKNHRLYSPCGRTRDSLFSSGRKGFARSLNVIINSLTSE